jgi:hypothetical protein
VRGHESIIALRLRGRMPSTVHVSCDPLHVDVWRRWPEYLTDGQVEIEPKDHIGLLDFRWAIHIPMVWVGGASPERVSAVASAIRQAGAKRVVAMVFEERRKAPHMVAMADTAGELTWQE